MVDVLKVAALILFIAILVIDDFREDMSNENQIKQLIQAHKAEIELLKAKHEAKLLRAGACPEGLDENELPILV